MEKSKKSIVLLVVIIVIVIILGGVAYYLMSNPHIGVEKINVESISLDNLDLEADQQKLAETKEILRQDPYDVDALISLATLQKWNASYEDGVKTLSIARQLRAEDTVILNNLGEMNVLAKDFKAAEQAYLDALELNSQWMNSYIWLNTIYKDKMPKVFATDKYPNLLKKGMEEDFGTNRLKFLQLLGAYYRDTDNKVEAIKYYQMYLEDQPNDQNIIKETQKLQE